MKTKGVALATGFVTSAFAAFIMLACGSDSASTGQAGGGSGHGGAFNPSGAGGVGGSNDVDAGNDCVEVSKLVYVISETDNSIYSFDPSKTLSSDAATRAAAFVKIGPPKCPESSVPTSGPPNSMALDRHGFALVNYEENGGIYKVDLQNNSLECTPTDFVSGGGIGFSPNLSMGFSSDALTGNAETLFVSDNTGDQDNTPGVGLGAARITDSGGPNMAAVRLGPTAFSGMVQGSRCELTGTGDAKLYGFFAENPAKLAEIVKSDGTTPSVTTLQNGGVTVDASNGGYAFSFWGGNFWFYTAPAVDSQEATASRVTRYDPATGELSVVLADVGGFVIVGAGVSTCAPLSLPPIK